MTKVVARRLEPFAERALGEYQCGFRRGRSTIDQVFTIRNILEKCYEYNIPVHQLFVDYKTAYDSVDRPYLFETLKILGVPVKIVNLIKMTLQRTCSKVTLAGQKSREFDVGRGLRQGDTLSCMLFNLTLERVVRKLDINPGGTLLNRTVHCLAYADDIDILSRREENLKESFQLLEAESKKAGLAVNESKTKLMVMTRRSSNVRGPLTVGRYSFERVQSFKYLGSLLTESNENSLEIKERIKAGNKAYYSMQHLLKSRLLSRKSKIRIYRTVLRPVVMYASETWVMTTKDEYMLNCWERKILRRIYGAVNDQGEWRIRTNRELEELYENPSLVTEIKTSRLRWLGHIERMPENRSARKVYRQRPEGRRLPGRPRLRWLDDVEDDLKELGVRGWRRRAVDRVEWKKLLKEAKALKGP
jgi:sorting nexin-29